MTNRTIFLNIYLFTNTQSGSNEKIIPFTEFTNITTTTPPVSSNGYFDTKLQDICTWYDQNFEAMFDQSDQRFEKNMKSWRQ